MTAMLAQTGIEALPASFWKNFCIALMALLGMAGAVIGIMAYFRKPEPTRLNDDPPIEVRKSPKRFNHELSEQRHTDHERRILALENERSELYDKIDNIPDRVIATLKNTGAI